MGGQGDLEPEDEPLNDRMCIVSRDRLPADRLIRFVVGPDGAVVPDLRRRLPGRGAHVEARRSAVEAAVAKNAFRRAFKGEGRAEKDLADLVESLLAKSALGALGLARKAGQLSAGAAKVEADLRSGRVLALLQARDGSPDGRRKMDGARHAGALRTGGGAIPVHSPFTVDEMSLALGRANVVHAAVLAGDAGTALLNRLQALEVYRGEDSATTDGERDRGMRTGSASKEEDGQSGDATPRTDEAPGTSSGQEAEV